MNKGNSKKPTSEGLLVNKSGLIGVLVLRVLLTTAAVLIGGYVAFCTLPAPHPRIQSWQGKVMYTLRWQLFPLVTLVLFVTVVAFTRLCTPALNPLNARGEQYVGVHVRCLQNTLEQLVLSAPAQLILSAYVESDSLRIIPIVVFLFVVGRLAFWFGYPLQRTYGFIMTFIPTVVIYAADIFFFFTAGPGYGLTD